MTSFRLALALILATCCLQANDKLAVVAGEQGGDARECEYLQTLKEWDTTRLPKAKLAEVADTFKKYDVVINGSGSGSDMPKDMWKKVAPQLKRYILDGGTFVLLSANTDYGLTHVIHHLGKEFEIGFEHCNTWEDKQQVTQRIWDRKMSVNIFPNDLQQLFRQLPLWAHCLPPKQAGWMEMARCGDDKSVMLYRNYGKGLIFVTNYFDFSNGKQRQLKAYLQNILAATKMNRARITMQAFNLGNSFGHNALNAKLTSHAKQPQQVAWAITQKGKQLKQLTVNLLPGQETTVNMPYFIDASEPLTVTMTLLAPSPKQHINAVREIEAPFVCLPWKDEVYPAIAPTFPIEIRLAKLYQDPTNYSLGFYADDKPVRVTHHKKNLYYADLRHLSPGPHRLKTTLTHQHTKDMVLTTENTLEVLPQNPENYVGIDNKVRFAGRKIFPLGFYHVTWKTPLKCRLEAVDFLHKQGKDLILFTQYNWPKDPLFEDFIAYSQKKNVKVRLGNMFKKVQAPNIMGYGVADEPDGRNVPKQQLMEQRRKLRQEAPDCFSTVVLATRRGFTEGNLRCADWIGHDPYPIPAVPITMVYYNLKELALMLEGTSHLPFAVLQCFGYPNDNFFKIPTLKEIRNMTYQALAAGANGIIYYTFMDGQFYLPDHPELLREMEKLFHEIRDLEPFLLDGIFNRQDTQTKDVFAATWKLNNQKLEMIVNGNRQDTQLTWNGKPLKLAPLQVLINR